MGAQARCSRGMHVMSNDAKWHNGIVRRHAGTAVLYSDSHPVDGNRQPAVFYSRRMHCRAGPGVSFREPTYIGQLPMPICARPSSRLEGPVVLETAMAWPYKRWPRPMICTGIIPEVLHSQCSWPWPCAASAHPPLSPRAPCLCLAMGQPRPGFGWDMANET